MTVIDQGPVEFASLNYSKLSYFKNSSPGRLRPCHAVIDGHCLEQHRKADYQPVTINL